MKNFDLELEIIIFKTLIIHIYIYNINLKNI